jgi:hypothetical protein
MAREQVLSEQEGGEKTAEVKCRINFELHSLF